MSSKPPDIPKPLKTIRRALSVAFAFPGPAGVVLICLTAGSALAIAGPLVVRRLVDEGILKHDETRVAVFAAAFLLVEAARTAVETFHNISLRRLAHATTGRLRQAVFRHLQRLPLSWFETTPAGEVVTSVTGDVGTMVEALSGSTVGLFRDLVILLGAGIVVIVLHPRLGIATLGIALVVGIPSVLIRRSAQRHSASVLEASSRTTSVLAENIAGHATIQLFGMESVRQERFGCENENLLGVSRSSLRMRVFYDAGASVASAVALTMVIAVGGAEIVAGRMSVGLFVAFLQFGSFLLGSVRGMAERSVAAIAGLAAADRVFKTLDLPPALPVEARSEALTTPKGMLTVSNVRFGYRDGVEVLKGISTSIKAGERVALVGKTGAGKTTLARLMARLYDPWEGRISWGNRDLRTLPLDELRRKTAYAPQSVALFSDTILENVRLGEPRVSRSEVVDACRASNAHAFIERLPQAYDTLIRADSLGLSDGQRQLLSFARILVRQPQILILDEPTASVDLGTEERVLEALDRVLEGRTSIVIAHRLSTLRGANKALLLSGGRIVEEGLPERVLAAFQKKGAT